MRRPERSCSERSSFSKADLGSSIIFLELFSSYTRPKRLLNSYSWVKNYSPYGSVSIIWVLEHMWIRGRETANFEFSQSTIAQKLRLISGKSNAVVKNQRFSSNKLSNNNMYHFVPLCTFRTFY